MDYPVVGYHNWKEVNHLSKSRNFATGGYFEHGFFVTEWDYPTLKADPSGAIKDIFPMLEIIISVLFSIFGIKLILARLVIISFSLGSILALYLLLRKITKNEYFPLFASLFLAIQPLQVFFGRNVQPESLCLFFMLLGFYFFYSWLEDKSNKNLIISTSLLLISAISKYNFLVIIAVVVLINFPYKYVFNKSYLHKNWKVLVSCGLIVLLLPFWFFYSPIISTTDTVSIYSTIAAVSLNDLPDFMRSAPSYIKDNFTGLGFILSLISLLLVLIMYFVLKKKTPLNKLILSFVVATVVYWVIAMDKMAGHSYHWMAFSPLFALLLAYGVTLASNLLKGTSNFFKKYTVLPNLITIAVVLVFLYPVSAEAWNRQFDVQFYGLDIAGDYIRQNKLDNERVMHSSHQAYGLLWHGNLKGTKGIPGSVEDMQFAMQELNANWLFIYNWDFNIMSDQNRWSFIQDNFEIKQAGFIQNGQNMQPVYFLLKEGGTFNISDLNGAIAKANVQQKNYESSSGTQTFYYANI